MGFEMGEIAVAEKQEVVQVAPQEDAFLSMIERVASDPQADVDKVERLYELYERRQAKASEVAFNSDMAEMQAELPVIDHTKEISYYSKKLQKHILKSTYTPWEDIDEKVRPIYTKYGFSLGFKIHQTKDDFPAITCTVRHRGGHHDTTTIKLPADMSGEKNAVQGVGSTMTYGKRYSACAALNITTRGHDGQTEDDDGAAAQVPMSAAKAKEHKLWEKLEAELRQMCATRSEAKDWYERTKTHSEEYRQMPTSWRELFFNEVFIPYGENLAEVRD